VALPSVFKDVIIVDTATQTQAPATLLAETIPADNAAAKVGTLIRRSAWLLPVILISYFVVGFPDGAFTAAWSPMAYEKGMGVSHSGFILVGYSVTYTLAGVLLAHLTKVMKLQTVYLAGLVVMAAGFTWLAFSGSFQTALLAVVVYGFGTGAMASSMNSYMAKHFTARHNNWMHCLWGAGAAVSPLIVGTKANLDTGPFAGWRGGYYVIIAIVLAVGIMLAVSMYKKIWLDDDAAAADVVSEDETTANNAVVSDDRISETNAGTDVSASTGSRRMLTKKWHQVVEIATFFFLGGTDYTLVFFTSVVLVNSRGLPEASVVIFPAIYYVFMTVGRMFFGWLVKFWSEIWIIRAGIALAVAGIVLLAATSNIAGMALTGFGLAPLLPTLVSDTSNRFDRSMVSKLVGLELAAFGAGIAALFFLTSQLLDHLSYELLFPIGIGFVALVFVCNEVLERVCRGNRKRAAVVSA
jgi:MFS family permease